MQNIATQFRPAAAAISGHELDQLSKSPKVGAIVPDPTLSLDQDKPGAAKDGQMC